MTPPDPPIKVTFDVDVDKITSQERQHDQFMRLMSVDNNINNEKTASEKFKPREIEQKDLLV